MSCFYRLVCNWLLSSMKASSGVIVPVPEGELPGADIICAECTRDGISSFSSLRTFSSTLSWVSLT